MRTRPILLTAIAVLCLGELAQAQYPAPFTGEASRPARGAEALKTVLDLTERQFMELDEMRMAYTAKVREITGQMRELETQRREAMRGADPTLVGTLALQAQALQQQLQEEAKAYRQSALSVLTAAQREKVEQIQEAEKLARQAGALRGFGLLENDGQMRGFMQGGPAMMMRGQGMPPGAPAGP